MWRSANYMRIANLISFRNFRIATFPSQFFAKFYWILFAMPLIYLLLGMESEQIE